MKNEKNIVAFSVMFLVISPIIFITLGHAFGISFGVLGAMLIDMYGRKLDKDLANSAIIIFMLTFLYSCLVISAIGVFTDPTSIHKEENVYKVQSLVGESLIIMKDNQPKVIKNKKLYYKCKLNGCTEYVVTVLSPEYKIYKHMPSIDKYEYDVR